MDPHKVNYGPGFTVVTEPNAEIEVPEVECNHCGNRYFRNIEDMHVGDCPGCGLMWVNT